jgi:hypothetical protein
MLRLISVAVATALVALAVGVSAHASAGPPGGTIYAFDQAFRTVITPTSIPDRGPFDTLYTVPDCASCASVSDAAPGHLGYNGGRWMVVAAYGITSQLTNAAEVQAAATSIVDTGTRFVCPLSHS